MIEAAVSHLTISVKVVELGEGEQAIVARLLLYSKTRLDQFKHGTVHGKITVNHSYNIEFQLASSLA